MSTKIVLLICVISFSKDIFLNVSSSSIISKFHAGVDLIRGSLAKINSVPRVQSTAALRARGNEFATLDFIGLVQQYDGYKAEEYDVETKDGYILKLHRISSSPLSPKASNKSVVYMQHSLAASSDIFVNLGPSHDLAFMLADAGYDVWLGNVRGNSYSRRHVKYSSASSNYDFWKFNLDDMAAKDVPAFIDTVLEKTNRTKLIYIGFAMGNTLSCMLLSSKPEYNDKIALSISLSPFVYFLEPDPSFLLISKTAVQSLIPVARTFRYYVIASLTKSFVAFSKKVCGNSIGKYLCGLITSPILSLQNVNFNTISSVYSVLISGGSIDTFDHFVQLANERKFRKFNFGPSLNKQKYNSSEPPEYDLSKITCPQAIFYAERDSFVNPKGAEKLKGEVQNVIAFEKVPKSYLTYDFIWAKDANVEYYYKILHLVKNFS